MTTGKEAAPDSRFASMLGFTGSLVAVVTPFREDGGIDYGALSELVAMHEESGTAGLFFLGVAGEGATLDDVEFEEFTRRVLAAKGTLAYYIGCTGRHTDDSARRVELAAEHGADGAILTVPANMGPDQAQAARYFLDVADRSPIPIGTFNNPARLLTDLDTATLLDLLEHPRIVLHKEGSPRTGQIGEVLAAGREVCFLADDSPDQNILVTSMALGARGIANAAGNLFPRELAALAVPWGDGVDLAAFRARYFRLLPVIKFLYGYRSPIGIKSMMNAIGLPAGHLRRPLTPLSDSQVKAGLDLIRSIGDGRPAEASPRPSTSEPETESA